jgi:hypothetical protein
MPGSEATMSNRNYQSLIAMGRKAGLNTSELYRALSSRPVDRQAEPGQTDCNGFTGGISQGGRMEYRPVNPKS